MLNSSEKRPSWLPHHWARSNCVDFHPDFRTDYKMESNWSGLTVHNVLRDRQVISSYPYSILPTVVIPILVMPPPLIPVVILLMLQASTTMAIIPILMVPQGPITVVVVASSVTLPSPLLQPYSLSRSQSRSQSRLFSNPYCGSRRYGHGFNLVHGPPSLSSSSSSLPYMTFVGSLHLWLVLDPPSSKACFL